MKNPRLMLALSYIVLALFCWIIYPIKWCRHLRFIEDREAAISKAEIMHARDGKKYHVVQNGKKFYVGNRLTLRALNSLGKKELSSSGLDFDYRNAIIYSTK